MKHVEKLLSEWLTDRSVDEWIIDALAKAIEADRRESKAIKSGAAHFCNQAGPMGGGCEDSWLVGGNYGSHVCRNPDHHDKKEP